MIDRRRLILLQGHTFFFDFRFTINQITYLRFHAFYIHWIAQLFVSRFKADCEDLGKTRCLHAKQKLR